MRLISPLTVEFRHADGISSSRREANSSHTWPVSASTPSAGAIRGPPCATTSSSASRSSRAIAPLPVQPSMKTIGSGPWRSMMYSSARRSIPRPRTIETL